MFNILFTSCVDYAAKLFQLDVSLNNNDGKEVAVDINYDWKGYNYRLTTLLLNQDNSYCGSCLYRQMGLQLKDYKNPVGELKEFLDEVVRGGTFIVSENGEDGIEMKFMIAYTVDDVEDITNQDDLCRRYKITLDWNKRVPIAE